MRILALVPARAGSKRLPGKNRELLGDVPLWERAVDVAIDSGVIDIVAVSTDDPEIKESIRGRKVAFIFDRPPELSRDETPMLPVLLHALECMRSDGIDIDVDAIMLLQPTSPFRSTIDLGECVQIMMDTNADTVVSVTDAGDDLAFKVRHANRLERLPDLVVENGAVYLVKTKALDAGLGFYRGELFAYRMPKDRSLDIDTPLDLELARVIFNRP